tara:strand:+ start:800 stop:1462 length:663 start_codon:yes stop_codon:yes gene_type:complete
MKITFISDTHGLHRQMDSSLLKGDMLIHCGDFMTDGYSLIEARDFLEWFSMVGNFKWRVLIAGNHDRLFEESPDTMGEMLDGFGNILYLQDILVNIEGINIYGTPYQPIMNNWAFNLPRHGKELESKWASIPDNTDILITHSPPYEVLDKVESDNIGSQTLLDRVRKVKPKIHAFGHIHECPGSIQKESTLFINAVQLDRDYNILNKHITVDWTKIDESA